jgi:tetratricopeptide (TPR) repeat protein
MRTDGRTRRVVVATVFVVGLLTRVHGGTAPTDDPDLLGRLGALEDALAMAPDSLERANDYRRAIIAIGQYNRSLAFFERLTTANPHVANAHLSYGYAYVDKIPAAGSITQVILANNALKEFTRALELEPSWLGYYTRGNAYLFWPLIFRRAPLGIADLERALQMQRGGPLRSVHVRVYTALGDGYWKTGQADKARDLWTEGARLFPESAPLRARLAASNDDLKQVMTDSYDPSKRVDTDLTPLWADR